MAENSTYSARPFISYDGEDDSPEHVRAEVKVVQGYGEVFDIEESDKGKAAKVSFKVSNTKFKPSGWAPVDSAVVKLAREAKAANEPLHFRIETHRKNNVDRKIPINDISSTADLARDNVFKSLAAVRRDDQDTLTMNPNALTNPAEDPRSTNGRYSALDMTPEQVEASKKTSGGSTSPEGAYRRRGFEGTPFEYSNPDGRRNTGAIAAKTPLLFLNFVYEHCKKLEMGEAIKDITKMNVAKSLLALANHLQVSIYEGALKAPDASLGSHTTARELVYKIAELYLPLTADIMLDKEKFEKWCEEAQTKALGMWQWSLKLTERKTPQEA